MSTIRTRSGQVEPDLALELLGRKHVDGHHPAPCRLGQAAILPPPLSCQRPLPPLPWRAGCAQGNQETTAPSHRGPCKPRCASIWSWSRPRSARWAGSWRAYPQAAALAVIANPFSGRVRGRPRGTDADRRGARCRPRREGGRGARRRAFNDRELWQGSDRRRGRRARACRGNLHPRLGKPLRQAVEKVRLWCRRPRRWAASARRSTCRSGTRTRPSVRSHFDAIEVRVPDAPRGPRSWSRSRSPTAAGRALGSAG